LQHISDFGAYSGYNDDMASNNSDISAMTDRIARLERRLKRSETARREAEDLLLSKSRELTEARQKLTDTEERMFARLERETQTLLRAQYLAEVATFQFDRNGQIISSRNLRDVIGSAVEIHSTQQILDMLHPLEALPVDALTKHIQSGGYVDKQSVGDIRFLDHQGETRWLRWNISQTSGDDDGDIMSYGAVRNITRERQSERRERALRVLGDRRLAKAEQLSDALQEKGNQLTQHIAELEAVGEALIVARKDADQANRSKSRFLAMMSHDIRTPLNAIMATFELLSVSITDPKQLELVQTASTSGDQLLFLLADIIQYARSDGWAIEPDIKTFDMRSLLESTVNGWRQLARKKSLPIILEAPDSLRTAIISDPVRLRQVTDNFLSNAIKYCQSGEINVDARIMTNADRATLKLSVKDQGPGIDAGRQRHIFSALDRAGRDENEAIEGTGLGLAICRRIAKALDGEVGMQPNTPMGCIFWFELPVKIATPSDIDAAQSEILQKPIQAVLSENIKILVAEDVAANRMMMGNILDNFHITYEFANDGVEAVKKAHSGQFDAILMDIAMPHMNGMDATRAIRKKMGAHQPLIFAVTAFSSPEEREAIIASGVDGIITKPITIKAIESVLQQITLQLGLSEPEIEATSEKVEGNVPIPDFERAEIIEKERVLDMFGGMEDGLKKQLIKAIETDLLDYFSQFESSIIGGDAASISRSHHALKGLCSGFGANALLAKLEHIREKPDAQTRKNLENARKSLNETVKALYQFRT